jgi:hypothetical protein
MSGMQEPAGMKKWMRGAVATLLAALFVAGGCMSKPSGPLPGVTFDHIAPINLNVAAVETRSIYKPSLSPPYVDHRFPVPPQEAMRRWASHRLKSVGSSDVCRFVILKASVIEERLTTDTGLLDPLKVEPAARYTVTLEGQLEITDASGRRIKGASARISRTRSLREGLSAEERDRAWIDLTISAMRDFDAAMTDAINKYVSDWIT